MAACWREYHIEKLPEILHFFQRIGVRRGLKVDAIVAPSSIYTAAAKRATSTIPVIFMSHADPLGTGHVMGISRAIGIDDGVLDRGEATAEGTASNAAADMIDIDDAERFGVSTLPK